MKRIAFILVLILLAISPVVATTYNVNIAIGNDGYSTVQAQNPATPWKTLAGAQTNATNGDIINVSAGTYDGMTFSKTISWFGAVGNTTIVKSTASKTITSTFVSNASADRFVFDAASDGVLIRFGSGAIFRNSTFIVSNQSALVSTSSGYIELTRCNVTAFNKTDSPVLDFQSSNTNIHISNSEFHSLSSLQDEAIGNFFKSNTAIIQNSSFTSVTNNAASHIEIFQASSIFCNPLVISNNTFDHNGTAGYVIRIGSEGTGANDNLTRNSVVSNNMIFGALYHNISVSATTHSIFLGFSPNGTIINNNITGGGYGVVLKGSVTPSFFGGILNNTFINCAGVYAIHLKGVQNITVENNTVFSTVGIQPAVFIIPNTGGDPATNSKFRYNRFNVNTSQMLRFGSVADILGFTAANDSYLTSGPDAIKFTIGSEDYNLSTWWSFDYDTPWPLANFTTNVSAGLAPMSVQFFDTSTRNTSTNWLWQFGDGSTSASSNPIYTYVSPGAYTVNLTAGNEFGTNLSQSQVITVYSISPSSLYADFVASPLTPTVGQTVLFTNMSSGGANTFNWSFGDGINSTLQNPSHAYSSLGYKNVTLTVTNATGASNTTTKYFYINVNTTGSGINEQDIEMDPLYALTLRFTDSTTNTAIPTVTVTTSDGQTNTSINGVVTFFFPYSTVVVYASATGYVGTSHSYVMDSDRDEVIQMTPSTVTQEPSIVYIPQQVRLRLYDMSTSYPLAGVNITATPQNFTAPQNWTQILLGINPGVAITNTSVMGITGSDGSWAAPMLQSINYEIRMVRSPDIDYTITLYPSQTEYVFTIPVGVVVIPTSASNVVMYTMQNVTINQSYQFFNITYQDTSGGTNNLTFSIRNATGAIVASASYTGVSANNKAYSQILQVTNGQSYTYGFSANQSSYGWINQTNTITLLGAVGVVGTTPGWPEFWAAVAMIIIFASISVVFMKSITLIGIPLLTWFFQFVLQWLPATFLSTIALGVMLSVGVLLYIRQKENTIQ